MLSRDFVGVIINTVPIPLIAVPRIRRSSFADNYAQRVHPPQ